MSSVKVNQRYQVTIPSSIRKRIKIRPGDTVEVEVKGTSLIISPRLMIDPSQTWFWTKEWQEMEREADEDLKKGRYKDYKDAKNLIKDLHRENKKA